MWPSHQPILKLSYEESLLFPDKSTATMLSFLIFGINLLPGKYLLPTSGRSRFYFLGILNYYLIPDEYFFPFQRNFMLPSSWEITCDPVIKRFLSSLMRKVCSSNINVQLLWYIFLPLKITFYQVNTFPTSWKIVSTSWAISKLPYTR